MSHSIMDTPKYAQCITVMPKQHVVNVSDKPNTTLLTLNMIVFLGT
jgi:hypothetical protein